VTTLHAEFSSSRSYGLALGATKLHWTPAINTEFSRSRVVKLAFWALHFKYLSAGIPLINNSDEETRFNAKSALLVINIKRLEVYVRF
jgi:hypothetical protein